MKKIFDNDVLYILMWIIPPILLGIFILNFQVKEMISTNDYIEESTAKTKIEINEYLKLPENQNTRIKIKDNDYTSTLDIRYYQMTLLKNDLIVKKTSVINNNDLLDIINILETQIKIIKTNERNDKNKKKELLLSITKNDFTIQHTKGSGKGGQNRNKRDTAVRVIHNASGSVGYSEEERYQHANKEIAFKRCTETVTFKKWLNKELLIIEGKILSEKNMKEEVDFTIEKDLIAGNIKVEYIDKKTRKILKTE